MPFDQIRDIICKQLNIDEDDVTMDTNLKKDLGLGSMDMLDLTYYLEDEFDVELPNDASDKFNTVGDIVRYFEEL